MPKWLVRRVLLVISINFSGGLTAGKNTDRVLMAWLVVFCLVIRDAYTTLS
jgi:hypothetical protein